MRDAEGCLDFDQRSKFILSACKAVEGLGEADDSDIAQFALIVSRVERHPGEGRDDESGMAGFQL
ncbi:MAG: hypothetical protein ACOY4C_01530, partial [Pseudomonadota bacterium]